MTSGRLSSDTLLQLTCLGKMAIKSRSTNYGRKVGARSHLAVGNSLDEYIAYGSSFGVGSFYHDTSALGSEAIEQLVAASTAHDAQFLHWFVKECVELTYAACIAAGKRHDDDSCNLTARSG